MSPLRKHESKTATEAANKCEKKAADRNWATTSVATNVAKIEENDSGAGKRGRKVAVVKKRHNKVKESFPIYKSCIMKFFVSEIFERIGEDPPLPTLWKKNSKETKKRIITAIRVLWLQSEQAKHSIADRKLKAMKGTSQE